MLLKLFQILINKFSQDDTWARLSRKLLTRSILWNLLWIQSYSLDWVGDIKANVNNWINLNFLQQKYKLLFFTKQRAHLKNCCHRPAEVEDKVSANGFHWPQLHKMTKCQNKFVNLEEKGETYLLFCQNKTTVENFLISVFEPTLFLSKVWSTWNSVCKNKKGYAAVVCAGCRLIFRVFLWLETFLHSFFLIKLKYSWYLGSTSWPYWKL